MAYIKLIRPWQWVKNLFVFLPMFFGRRLGDVECWSYGVLAFFAISFIASSIYCLNDVMDADENRRHPRKRFRPVASGAISKGAALCMMAFMAMAGFALLGFTLEGERLEGAMTIAGGYFLLNVAYCLKLKQFAIVDVFCIALGFVLRILIGGEMCEIWVSPWIVCLTFLLTLFMSFAKRRDDVSLYETTGEVARENTLSYNLAFMNQVLGLLGAITIVCYIIYTVQPEVEARFGSGNVYVTAIFVLAGILRYLQLALVADKAGDPTDIMLRDRFIQACVVAWLLTFAVIIYL